MKKLIAALFAVSLAAAPAFARPGGDHHGPPMMNPERIDRMAEALNLEPAVAQKIKDRVTAAKKEQEQLRDDLHAARQALRQLLDQDNPDRNAVLRQVDIVNQKEAALEKLKIGTLLDVRSMLTPEQRQKLRAMQEEHRRDKKGKGKGRDRDRGGDDDDRGPGRHRGHR